MKYQTTVLLTSMYRWWVLPVHVETVQVHLSANRHEVPDHRVVDLHVQMVGVAAQSAVDGVHDVTFLEVSIRPVFRALPVWCVCGDVVLEIPALILIHDSHEQQKLVIHVLSPAAVVKCSSSADNDGS